MEKLKHDFYSAAKDYGLCRIFLSIPFIVATLLAIGFVFLLLFHTSDSVKFLSETAAQIQIVSVGIFSILFAGFTIFISLSDETFVKFLQSKKIFSRLLFPFWFDSILYLLAIFVSFVAAWTEGLLRTTLIVIAVWFVLWAILDTFYLVMSIVLFGYYRASFIEYKKEIEEIMDENSKEPMITQPNRNRPTEWKRKNKSKKR